MILISENVVCLFFVAGAMHQDGSIWILNINDLGETHGGFFKEIMESVTGKSRKRIGEVFVEYNERFLRRVPRPAAQGHAAAGHAGLHGRDDRGGAEEVSKCEKAAGKFKLVDLLTVPMQRILKYHMLLQRLVGQTHASHEEYHSIEQAYNCIINVSEVSL